MGSGGSGLITANGPVSPITYEQAREAALTVCGRCEVEQADEVLQALGIKNILIGLDQ